MNRTVWMHRAAAVAAVGLMGVALASTAAIVGDLQAVAAARADAPLVHPVETDAAGVWKVGRPLLRRNGTNAQIAIGEYLNGHLGELGLAVSSAQTSTLRPLGGGLQLAEVRVQARGDAADTAALANWIAVNREAVRLKSMTLSLGPDGDGAIAVVLLMVIA